MKDCLFVRAISLSIVEFVNYLIRSLHSGKADRQERLSSLDNYLIERNYIEQHTRKIKETFEIVLQFRILLQNGYGESGKQPQNMGVIFEILFMIYLKINKIYGWINGYDAEYLIRLFMNNNNQQKQSICSHLFKDFNNPKQITEFMIYYSRLQKSSLQRIRKQVYHEIIREQMATPQISYYLQFIRLNEPIELQNIPQRKQAADQFFIF